MTDSGGLKASFLRTVGDRDRIYVVRSDGSEVSWAFPNYGDALPHDLIHLVVEAAFGLAQGFWWRVDAVRVVLKRLASQWRGFIPKGAIQLAFDPRDPSGTFDRLSKEEAIRG